MGWCKNIPLYIRAEWEYNFIIKSFTGCVSENVGIIRKVLSSSSSTHRHCYFLVSVKSVFLVISGFLDLYGNHSGLYRGQIWSQKIIIVVITVRPGVVRHNIPCRDIRRLQIVMGPRMCDYGYYDGGQHRCFEQRSITVYIGPLVLGGINPWWPNLSRGPLVKVCRYNWTTTDRFTVYN